MELLPQFCGHLTRMSELGVRIRVRVRVGVRVRVRFKIRIKIRIRIRTFPRNEMAQMIIPDG